MQFISKDGREAILRLGGIGKNLGGILLMSITTKTYPALIDPGKPDRKLIGPLIRGMILKINLEQHSSKFGNSQQQFTVTDGGCKHKNSNTEKRLRKRLRENNGYGI